ncbi:MAG: thioredoxin domain-containing protein [Myxococcales bacterium]|nr:thioredoxin domain-containing protein [Myxococcales bacterium]
MKSLRPTFTLVAIITAIACVTACEKKSATGGDTAALEARLVKMEKRVDKIIEVLSQAMGPGRPNPKDVYKLPIGAADIVEGPANAKVTIVETFEFLCPYCWQFAPVINQVKAAFPNDVRFVYKHLVIHGEPALPPALAACAASKQEKFHDMSLAIFASIFTSEGKAIAEKSTAPELEKLAATLKLDMAKYKADVASPACQAWLTSGEGLRDVGVTGTPSVYVNGKPTGPAPFPQLKAAIEEEIKIVDASGIAPADYYQKTVIEKGKTSVPGPFDE